MGTAEYHARRIRIAMRSIRSCVDRYVSSGDSADYRKAQRVIQSDALYPDRGNRDEDEAARWFGVRAAGRWLLLEGMWRVHVRAEVTR